MNRAKPFVEQLVTYFTEFYVFFIETPQLSRDMLREITFHSGLVATRLWAGVQSQERHIAELIAHAQDKIRVSPDFDPDVLAHIIFSLHRTQLRFCLDEDEPDAARNLDNLRRQFEVVFAQRIQAAKVYAAPRRATVSKPAPQQKVRLRA